MQDAERMAVRQTLRRIESELKGALTLLRQDEPTVERPGPHPLAVTIEERRRRLGLSKAEVARQTGINESHFRRLLKGTSAVGPRVAPRLAWWLGQPDDVVLRDAFSGFWDTSAEPAPPMWQTGTD